MIPSLRLILGTRALGGGEEKVVWKFEGQVLSDNLSRDDVLL